MNSILIRNSETYRFDLSDPTPIAECDFEQTAKAVLKELYKDCWVIPFRAKIQYNGENWCPDLALVDKNFRYWFVIEIEVSTHSLQKHVLPQVCAFKGGDYGDDAERVLTENLKISPDRAKTLLSYVPRYVAVINNLNDPTWERALHTENVQFMAIMAYNGNYTNKQALLISGSLTTGEQNLGFGLVHASQQLISTTNANLFWIDKHEYKINDPQGLSTWVCAVEETRVWLAKKQGVIRIPEKTIVQILLQSGQIIIQPCFLT